MTHMSRTPARPSRYDYTKFRAMRDPVRRCGNVGLMIVAAVLFLCGVIPFTKRLKSTQIT